MVSEMSKENHVKFQSYPSKEGWNIIQMTDPQRANVETSCETVS